MVTEPAGLVPDTGQVEVAPARDLVSDDVAEDLAGVLASLLEDVRFTELAVALRSVDSLGGVERRRVLALCDAGARLLMLDAADFAEVDGVPAGLRADVLAMQFPQRPDGEARGSLGSLVPLYGLMLEALAVHWDRGDTTYVLLVLHLMAEYLPLLAWEGQLGHAGDPLRLRPQVDGTLWGTRECPMPGHRRSASLRVLAMDPAAPGGGVHPQQWSVYLDRWHARVSGALRQCALRPGDGRPNPEDGGCDRECGVIALAGAAVPDLAARMALATDYAASPVVALRHSAPVGHFFGVPGCAEVRASWDETVTWICRDWAGPGRHGGNPVGGGLVGGGATRGGPARGRPPTDGHEPLPGLQALLSAVAGRPVRPSSLLGRLRDEVAAAVAGLLEPASEHGNTRP